MTIAELLNDFANLTNFQEWARRPLSKVMIEMARDYVCFLPALHAIIIKNLSKSSLWQVAVQSDELSRHYYSPISVMFG